MHQYRVTKYDPRHRDENGNYHRDGWTCPSDIGQVFDGTELTVIDYLGMEDNYISAVLRFFDASGLPHLRVACLEKRFAAENLAQIKASQPDLFDPAIEQMVLSEDQKVGRNEIALICRMILRNIIWCKLEFTDRFFVHFGWDFYMYIGTAPGSSDAIKQAENDGLFVERFASPHGRRPGVAPLIVLEVCRVDTGDHSEDIELSGVSIEAVRNALGFSAEHPVDGIFALARPQVTAIELLIDQKLDLEQFSYCLDLSGEQVKGV